MSTVSLVTIKAAIRQRLNDEGVFVQKIIPIGICDGTNTYFQLPGAPLDSSSLTLLKNDSSVLAADYTLDADTGQLTFATAPINGSKLLASYKYWSSTDTKISNYVHRAEMQLQSVWDLAYEFNGSGATEYFTTEPDVQPAEALILYSAIIALSARIAEATYVMIDQSDASGRVNTTARVAALRELRREYRQELDKVLRGMGKVATLVSGDLDYGIVHHESWV